MKVYGIRHKETGEWYTGQNQKAPKIYVKEATAKGAIKNALIQQPYLVPSFLGMSLLHFHELCRQDISPSKEAVRAVVNAYLDAARARHPDKELVRDLQKKKWQIERQYNDAFAKRRAQVIDEHLQWEVTEFTGE